MTKPRYASELEPITLVAQMSAVVATLRAELGDYVSIDNALIVLEVMKMEHPVVAPASGRVSEVHVSVGESVVAGQALMTIDPKAKPLEAADPPPETASDHAGIGADTSQRERADLAELRRAQDRLADEARPEAVAKRHGRGQRTARENVAALVDPNSFHEYGGFAIAAQVGRRSREDLEASTPADGLITGLAKVNSSLVGEARAACAVVAYDYTVMAGTQGYRNHAKKDRIFEIIERLRVPVVLFAEGGGGRPGDTDVPVISGLDTRAFELFARLSGQVPTVGIAAGRCFAGNAALLGCCDTIIATADSNIGMGGPAMIEGGGLGTFRPEEIGPIDVQVAGGVVDVAVNNEEEAVEVARKYLSYFQGSLSQWRSPDQERLRQVVPEHRKAIYDVRSVVEGLADIDSVLELRRGFGDGMITALVRLEGTAVGIIANDPAHLGGAIDRDAADKAARFMSLCDVHELPVVFLCDTPGFMVGPDAERNAQVRHFARLFVTAAAMTVPFGTVVLRKGYGLGAQAMAGGSFRAGLFTLSWPTGEFGGMGLEGAVRLGFRRELEAIDDEEERAAAFDRMVEAAYERGRALNMAAHLEIDDVIDPAETRSRVLAAIRSAPPRNGPPRRFLDAW